MHKEKNKQLSPTHQQMSNPSLASLTATPLILLRTSEKTAESTWTQISTQLTPTQLDIMKQFCSLAQQKGIHNRFVCHYAKKRSKRHAPPR